MTLSWVSCLRRVNDFGNQKGCGMCLVTAMNKIDCQLHFYDYFVVSLIIVNHNEMNILIRMHSTQHLRKVRKITEMSQSA